MTEPIVVGVDGSQASRIALDWAVDSVVRTGRSLRIVGAYDPAPSGAALPMLLPGDIIEALRSDATEAVREAAEHVRMRVPDADVHSVVMPEPAVSALTMQSQDAALTVVGTRHLSGVRSVFFGSVSVNLAAHAVSDVVVVAGPAGPGPVIAAVDGSALTERVLDRAFAAAEVFGTSVTVVHAWTDLDESTLATGALDADVVMGAVDTVRAQVRTWVEPVAAHRPGVGFDVVVTPDGAAAAVRRLAADARLIVIGSRGRGGLVGMLLGSTSQSVLHHAVRPVLVVKS